MDSLISFIESSSFLGYEKLFPDKKTKPNSIYLLDCSYDFNVFQYLPRLFTITTKNKSSIFNIDMLKESSSVIENFLLDNPNIYHYHLDIDDENNVLSKFEDLYQGKVVYFTKKDYHCSQQITKLLNIQNFPILLSDQFSKNSIFPNYTKDNKGKILIDKSKFKQFLRQKLPQNFTIKTKKNEYKCNQCGILSSIVIRNLFSKDSNLNQFYYDFDDEFNEFQTICDFFNFKKVYLTENNMNSIKKISKDLQISSVYDFVLKYIQTHENLFDVIDKHKETIESIDNLFNLLCNINEKSVDFVKNKIMESFWPKTEDNVKELAAFTLKIIKIDISLHRSLIDLLMKLDKEANETNFLNILIPFISKKLMRSFEKHLSYCSFIYILYKKGFIEKKEILNHLKLYILDDYRNSKNLNNLYAWFWPEIIEIDLLNYKTEGIEKTVLDFIQVFLDNNDIESYKYLRDIGEPNDKITKTIRCDDVDTLQYVISNKNIDIIDTVIPFNFFEKIVFNGKISLLNYASAHGSIKCFKYLLLNHAEINEDSLLYAIRGKNIEIIKIVDQVVSDNNFYIENQKERTLKQIKSSIKLHMNDLFDWIFEKSFLNIDQNSLRSIVRSSAKNGNAHSLIEIVSKGMHVNFDDAIEFLWGNGFYRLSKIIIDIVNNLNEKEKNTIYDKFIGRSTSFGNLSIFKLYQQISTQSCDLSNLLSAIEYDSINIIEYFFEALDKKKLQFTENTISESFKYASKKSSGNLFKYLMKQFKKTCPEILENYKYPIYIMINAIENGNFEVFKIVYDKIIQQNEQLNLTMVFKTALLSNNKDIYQYFIDQKVKISFDELIKSYFELVYIDLEAFSTMYEFFPTHYKSILIKIFLYPAIEIRNIKLIQFLLEKQIPCNDELVKIISHNDLELFELILKFNSSPIYINKRTTNGTALSIAVQKENLNIIKRLLSLPGIKTDVNAFDKTPFMYAVDKSNIEILNLFLDFFGNDKSLAKRRQYEYLFDVIFKKIDQEKLIDQDLIIIANRILDMDVIDISNFISKYKIFEKIIRNNNIKLLNNLFKLNNIDFYLNEENFLIDAIKNDLDDMAELLINCPLIDINTITIYYETPLSVAVQRNKTKIIYLLIKNDKFNPEENSLNSIFIDANFEISKLLLSSKYIDVNYINYIQIVMNNSLMSSFYNIEKRILYQSALMNATQKNDIKKIDLIIHHSQFDKNKSFFRNAIFISIKNNFIQIFNKLIELEDNINDYEYSNESLLSIAVKNNSIEIIKIILQNENLDSKKNFILNCFINTLVIRKESYEIMKILIDYDKQHDNLINFKRLLPDGTSFFTSIKEESIYINELPNIDNIVNLLLKNGADPNLQDKNSVYPLQHALEMKSKNFIIELLNSNKIDLKNHILRNKQTYLHLAAYQDPKVFNEFLNKNIIDINSKDRYGMTPLMMACKFKKRENVELLFKFDNLDYLCCNKDGDDALKIVYGPDINSITDRDSYYLKLIEGLS